MKKLLDYSYFTVKKPFKYANFMTKKPYRQDYFTIKKLYDMDYLGVRKVDREIQDKHGSQILDDCGYVDTSIRKV